MPCSVRSVDIDRARGMIQRKRKVRLAAIRPEKSDLIEIGEGESGGGRRELRIEIYRPLEETAGSFIFLRLELSEMPHAPVIGLPGIEAVGRLAGGALALAALHCGEDCRRDTGRDLVLHREYIRQIAIVAFRPKMSAGRRLDQLPGHPNPIAGLAHAAFEHIAHAQLAADRFYV